jgi:NAD+ synthase
LKTETTVTNTRIAQALVIDCAAVTEAIVTFIQKKVTEEKRAGVVLGLSGGIDSAVAATLAVKAVGPSHVYALHLFDRQSDPKFQGYAAGLAKKLGINFEARDITASVRAQGAYRLFIMRISPRASRALIRMTSPMIPVGYRFRGRTPPSGSPSRRAQVERSFNVRHIERRRTLEAFARENNLLLIGAANRSEAFVGWFVKDGVDDLPVEVIMGLYKTQVRQLARCLGVPEEIMRETPSPDMLRGITDEATIGVSYETVDKVAYALEHGLGEAAALSEGVSRKEFERVRRLHELTVWKRTNPHEFPAF